MLHSRSRPNRQGLASTQERREFEERGGGSGWIATRHVRKRCFQPLAELGRPPRHDGKEQKPMRRQRDRRTVVTDLAEKIFLRAVDCGVQTGRLSVLSHYAAKVGAGGSQGTANGHLPDCDYESQRLRI